MKSAVGTLAQQRQMMLLTHQSCLHIIASSIPQKCGRIRKILDTLSAEFEGQTDKFSTRLSFAGRALGGRGGGQAKGRGRGRRRQTREAAQDPTSNPSCVCA
jgi:hypothetical protein